MKRIVVAFALVAAACASRNTILTLPEGPRWWFFFEEERVHSLILDLTARHRPQTVAFIGATVLPMNGEAIEDGVVVVRDGRIESAGPRTTTPVPADAKRIDARGKFLMPGLTDAHVHATHVSSMPLMNVAHGVTTVREMAGFPYLLERRDLAKANALFIPSSVVAGPILNAYAMGGVAQVVTTPEEGRRRVAEHRQVGYDFIKIHNGMSREVYDAVMAAARAEGLRVVGHIPAGMTVQYAADSGQWTFEHLKGYIDDRTLTMRPEDGVAARTGAAVWDCPTLSNRRVGSTRAEVEALLASEQGRYVSAREKVFWLGFTEEKEARSARRVWELSQEIFPRLAAAVPDRIIAGTDAGGGYPNRVGGYALLDELETLQGLGLPVPYVLKSATVHAAAALERADEYGTIEAGKRADLLLLDRDPRQGAANLRNPRGVMMRGIWLDRAALDGILRGVERIYADAARDRSLKAPSEAQLAELVSLMERNSARGWPHATRLRDELAAALRARGLGALADRAAAL